MALKQLIFVSYLFLEYLHSITKIAYRDQKHFDSPKIGLAFLPNFWFIPIGVSTTLWFSITFLQ